MLSRYQQPVISLENAQRPANYHEAILRMGELGILPAEFARRFAPISGFRNILVHEYLTVDWDEVYENLQKLVEIEYFAECIRRWLLEKHE